MFKVSSLSIIAVVVKFFTSLINSKITAYFFGPSGIALLENFRNIFTFIDTTGQMGVSAGVTADIIRSRHQNNTLYEVLATSFWVILIWSFILSLGVFFSIPYLTNFYVLNKISYTFLFLIFALYPFVVTQSLFQAFLNGFELYSKIIYGNIFSAIFLVILNLILAYYYGIVGILCSTVLLPIFLLIYYLICLNKKLDVLKIFLIKNIKFLLLKRYYKFSIMLLLSGIFVPGVYLAIRTKIIYQLGWFDAGIWSALTRISNSYFILPTTLISYYFFPKLLKTNTVKQSLVFIKKYLNIILPIFICLFTFAYLFSDFWIELIFTREFFRMKSYLFIQFFADFLKIITLIFGYYFIAKKRVFAFVVCEIVSLFSFYFFSQLLISIYGLLGVLYGHLIAIILYLIAVLFFYILELKFSKNTF